MQVATSPASVPPAEDEAWMGQALTLASSCLRNAPQQSDVPIGALCVYRGEIISTGSNIRQLHGDPTGHAEVLALRGAAAHLGRRHLDGVTLYVTLEPCPMCAGALWLARISRLVFGAWDEKAGACGSLYDITRDPRLNFRPQVRGGVLEDQCSAILKRFFEPKRDA